jgi:glutamate-ammonia-ligase adenylyltransferase
MDVLREAHHAQVFRVLAQDLAGRLSVERLSDHLSEIADRVLAVVLDTAWRQLRGIHREIPRFTVVAYGKLGGKELGYASDLDLVFVFDDDDERAPPLYAQLAQRLSAWLSTRTAAGLLFEIDLRLRPNGNAGLLVSSLRAFETYQRESAWVWEHQALTRARYAAGDPALGARFEALRREILAMPRAAPALRDEVRTMRRKMLEGHPNRSALFDVKHDPGGMVDIEFLVQYLVLAHAATHPQLLENVGNIALLDRAAQAGLIDATAAADCAQAYRDLRRLQHVLRLNDARFARVEPATVAAQSAAVKSLWRAVIGD